MRGLLRLSLALLVFGFLLHNCIGDVEARKGTIRVSRMISDTRPWFDCMSEEYEVAGNSLTCGDDTNDDAPPIQACINAAGLVAGVAYLGQCDIDIDTSLELNNRVTLMGCGANSSWAANETDGRKGCTTITMDDDMTTPAIYIRGDPANSRGSVVATGDMGSEGVSIIGIRILSETVYDGATGIKIDGTYADEVVCDEPGGCPSGCTPGSDCTCVTAGAGPDPLCRGSVRDVVLEDVGCYATEGNCLDLVGNVFDVTMTEVFSYATGDTGIVMRQLANGTCNNGVCGVRQTVIHDGLFVSCDRGDATCDNATWAVDTEYTYYDGGHIQGDYGAKLGQNSLVIGTHIENDSSNPTAGNVGIQLTGRNSTIITNAIQDFDNCVVIGEDGSSNIVDSFFVDIGVIQNCDLVGLTIEDGGQRRGVFHVGHWSNNGADIDNQQPSVVYDGDIVHSIIGQSLKFNSTSTSDSIYDLKLSDVRIGTHAAADQTLAFMTSNNQATVPKLMWDSDDSRFRFDDTTELAIGDGAATDQKLTFVDDAGDHTFHYDTADEVFELDGKLKVGGVAPGITASASNDFDILVDDGQFVKPDTMIQKSCTVASADSTAVDDCNVLTLTGSTNIDTITTCNAANTNRQLLVLCGAYTGDIRDDSVDSGNIKMAGDANLTCTTFDTLLLVCDASYWLEVSRSVN